MFIIRLIDDKGIESCGFAVKSEVAMNDYVAALMANLNFYIQRIMVYRSEGNECSTVYHEHRNRTTIEVYNKGMTLYKDLYVGMAPKEKRSAKLA